MSEISSNDGNFPFLQLETLFARFHFTTLFLNKKINLNKNVWLNNFATNLQIRNLWTETMSIMKVLGPFQSVWLSSVLLWQKVLEWKMLTVFHFQSNGIWKKQVKPSKQKKKQASFCHFCKQNVLIFLVSVLNCQERKHRAYVNVTVG